MTIEGISMNLENAELSLVHASLIAYRERMQSHQKNMAEVAAALREGETVPLFAEGENGARAADHMVQDFVRTEQRIVDLLEKLENEW